MRNTLRIKPAVICFFLLPVLLLAADHHAGRYYAEASQVDRGSNAPGFSLKDLTGKDVSLESFRGKPVLLNFWATWCPYCRKERSHLNTLHNDYKNKGLVILSISTDRSIKALNKFMKESPADFKVLSDNDGHVSSMYNIRGLPSSLLLDRDGVIKYKFTGFREWTSKSSQKIIDSLF